MRTVDPDLWYKKVKKHPLNVSRPLRFGVEGVSVFEKRLRSSFHDAMVEFCSNCCIEGVSFIVDKSNPKLLRWCYLIILFMSISSGLYLMAWSTIWFVQRPHLIVNDQMIQHPVQHIDFPAVGICSYNTISRSALEDYAQFIHSLDINNTYTVEKIKLQLLAFSAIHTLGSYPYDFRFMDYLKNVAHENNITNILYKLSPDCRKMLEHCSWRARRVRCSRIFAKRITSIGFCCIFNSRYHPVDRNNWPHQANLVGEDSGLSVVVRENPDDFTYVQRIGHGFDVLLIDGNQYPIARAGIIRRVPVERNASVFIQMTAHAQQTSEDLLFHSDKWLGCHMRRREDKVDGSWSWCVSQCRRKAILALCLCVPHTLPPLNQTTVLPCSLKHVACLAKHRDKFSSIYPGDDAHETLSEEQSNSIKCDDCQPDCARQRYSATLTTVPFELVGDKMFLNNFLKGLDMTNTTILRIYYTTEKQYLYLLETSVRWYEALATIDSQWVFIVGVTAVSILELIYHCTFRWYYHYVRGCQAAQLRL